MSICIYTHINEMCINEYINIYICVYVYISIYTCVCVCLEPLAGLRENTTVVVTDSAIPAWNSSLGTPNSLI